MRKLTIKDMKSIAKERGGKCLSDSYINARKKLIWECAEGHQLEATPDKVKRGRWCPHCAGTIKLTIKEMHAIAEERGGKCLSGTYINNRTKLIWECAEGHQWEATPDKVKRGRWCRECTYIAKKTKNSNSLCLPIDILNYYLKKELRLRKHK